MSSWTIERQTDAETVFHSPASVPETVELLGRLQGRVRLLAGGTDVVVELNEGQGPPPEHLVYLGRLDELKTVSQEDHNLKLGALLSHAQLAADSLVCESAPLIAAAAGRVGGPAIRTMGTIGGNVATASPAGDVSTALLALEAQAEVMGPAGRRTIPLTELFLGPGQTCLAADELICHFSIALKTGLPVGHCFEKFGQRRAMSIATVSCAAALWLEPDKRRIAAAALSLGSVAPTPLRAVKAEAKLVGAVPDEELFAAAAQTAAGECSPIDDIRASAGYRRELAAVLVRRCLSQASRLARGAEPIITR
ncbi:MAG: xanthine dehydrogenase family protein subunit M [Deltaproteobacteria bacterium]|nr:xanthine dehydrogenase family protein subunit M [Deltaproteobacteria bacterium]